MCTDAIAELRKSPGPGITIAGVVMTYVVATAVLCIAVGGVEAQRVAARLRLTAIVLLFGFGLLIGPELQILHPAVAFGSELRPMVGLAVAIVVFEGGLALDFRDLRRWRGGVAAHGGAADQLLSRQPSYHLLGGMPFGPSLLYGAITVVTGLTVVLPLLRNIRLQARTSSSFKWEAIVNDPIGALMAR